MHIEYLFFFIYLFGCFWFFPKIGFIRASGLNGIEIRILLAMKLVAAVAIAYYFSKLPYSDYKGYNNGGLLQYEILKSNPAAFLTKFGDVDQHAAAKDLFKSSYNFWTGIKDNMMFKCIAIFNLLTAGTFLLNSVVFSSLTFFAHIGFYKIFRSIYPNSKWPLVGACFLLPSLLMYTSCVHKDGVIFLALGAICTVFYRFLTKTNWPGFKHIAVLGIAFATIFIVRNYILVALLPAIFTVAWCKVFPARRRHIVLGSYLIYTVLFFTSSVISPSLNLPEAVIQRKTDFALLGLGNTNLAMNDLQPNIKDFVVNIPQAINHSLMRPYLWEFTQPSVILVAMELLLYQLLLALFFFYKTRERGKISDFNLFSLLFFFSMMLIIGYTIPNVGAIVRYRSIFWVLVLCPIVCNIDWEKLRNTIVRKSAVI